MPSIVNPKAATSSVFLLHNLGPAKVLAQIRAQFGTEIS